MLEVPPVGRVRSPVGLLRIKKEQLPPGANERDRALFGKLRNHMTRVDDVLLCKRCQRKFEIPSQQSIVFV